MTIAVLNVPSFMARAEADSGYQIPRPVRRLIEQTLNCFKRTNSDQVAFWTRHAPFRATKVEIEAQHCGLGILSRAIPIENPIRHRIS
jgi:hypothetical protein